jgi:hypothetical protein
MQSNLVQVITFGCQFAQRTAVQLSEQLKCTIVRKKQTLVAVHIQLFTDDDTDKSVIHIIDFKTFDTIYTFRNTPQYLSGLIFLNENTVAGIDDTEEILILYQTGCELPVYTIKNFGARGLHSIANNRFITYFGLVEPTCKIYNYNNTVECVREIQKPVGFEKRLPVVINSNIIALRFEDKIILGDISRPNEQVWFQEVGFTDVIDIVQINHNEIVVLTSSKIFIWDMRELTIKLSCPQTSDTMYSAHLCGYEILLSDGDWVKRWKREENKLEYDGGDRINIKLVIGEELLFAYDDDILERRNKDLECKVSSYYNGNIGYYAASYCPYAVVPTNCNLLY